MTDLPVLADYGVSTTRPARSAADAERALNALAALTPAELMALRRRTHAEAQRFAWTTVSQAVQAFYEQVRREVRR